MYYFCFSVKQTVACCKHVLKDYWTALRIDSTVASQIWIDEAHRKRSVESMATIKMMINVRISFVCFSSVCLRLSSGLASLVNSQNRPIKYDLTPTLIINRSEEQTKKIEDDIQRALTYAPHRPPLYRG
jgi:hypothetical protein